MCTDGLERAEGLRPAASPSELPADSGAALSLQPKTGPHGYPLPIITCPRRSSTAGDAGERAHDQFRCGSRLDSTGVGNDNRHHHDHASHDHGDNRHHHHISHHDDNRHDHRDTTHHHDYGTTDHDPYCRGNQQDDDDRNRQRADEFDRSRAAVASRR